MQIFKEVTFKLIAFIAIFLLLQAALSFITVPANSQVRVAMHDFYQQTDLDIVFVGASTMFRSVVPEIVDGKLGSNCFVMSTNGQKMADSYYWMKEMYKTHTPSTVVLEINANRFRKKAPDSAMRLYIEYQRSANKLSYFINGFQSSDYVRVLFPGVYYAPEVLTSSKLVSNPLEKLGQNYKNYIYDYGGYDGKYVAKGHFSTTMQITRGNLGRDSVRNQMAWDPTATDAESIDYFEKIVYLCAANNTKLLCVSSPILLGTAADTGNYQQLVDDLMAFCDGYGVDYYNFTLLRPDVFDNGEYGYRDAVHMNTYGAEPYSVVLADFLDDYLTGTLNPHDYLLPSFVARMAAEPPRILSVQLEHNKDKDSLEAFAVADASVTPEYEFLYKTTGEDGFTTLRGYETSARLLLPDLAAGKYTFRVNARARGLDVEYDQYYQLKLTIE